MLAQRVLSAVLLAPVLIVIVSAGEYWYLALVVGAALVACGEIYILLRRAGYSPLWPIGLALAFALLLESYLSTGWIGHWALSLAILLSLSYLVIRQSMEGSLVDWAITWLPPLYVGVLSTSFIALRQHPQGLYWVYLLLGVTWATDVGAYFVGRAVGRHGFFRAISPKKTLEGAVGGAMVGVACGVALAALFGWDLPRVAAFSLVATVAAEIGDLAESLLKRQLKAKDAGHLIPGHGGVLDRMDSLLFVGVVAQLWATWIGGI